MHVAIVMYINTDIHTYRETVWDCQLSSYVFVVFNCVFFQRYSIFSKLYGPLIRPILCTNFLQCTTVCINCYFLKSPQDEHLRHLFTLNGLTQHDNDPTLSVHDHLPEIPTSAFHGRPNYNECVRFVVVLCGSELCTVCVNGVEILSELPTLGAYTYSHSPCTYTYQCWMNIAQSSLLSVIFKKKWQNLHLKILNHNITYKK